MAISLGAGFFTVKARDEASAEIRALGQNVRESLGGLAQTAVTSMAVAGTAVIGFLGASVKAFADSERATAQLEAVIKSTGGAAGVTAQSVLDYADAVQKKTAYEGDSVVATSALLLTFTNIGKDVFPMAMDAILDMSTAMGQDLKGSAIQVGKALNDPVAGITALTRVGVTFTEQQKEMIKYLVETGQVADAQRLVIAELAKEFGGSAAAEAATFSGQVSQLKNQLGDMMEVIGASLIPVFQELQKTMQPLIETTAAWISSNPEATEGYVKWAGGIALVSIALKGLMPLFSAVGLAWQALSGAIVLIAAAIGAPVWAVVAVITAVGLAIWSLVEDFGGVRTAITDILTAFFVAFYAWSLEMENAIGEFVALLIKGMTDPFGAMSDWLGAVFGWISQKLEWLVNIWQWAFDKIYAMWSWMSSAVVDLAGWALGVPSGDGGGVPGMATGGLVNRSGLVKVGEYGAELLYLPRGAEVVPARETAALLGSGGGGGVNVAINLGGVTIREEADMDRLVGKMTSALERTLGQRGLRLARS